MGKERAEKERRKEANATKDERKEEEKSFPLQGKEVTCTHRESVFSRMEQHETCMRNKAGRKGRSVASGGRVNWKIGPSFHVHTHTTTVVFCYATCSRKKGYKS